MRRWLSFIPIAALVLVVLLSVFVLTRGGPPQTITAGQIGRPTPVFALARLGGGDPVRNDAFAGRVHIINVFASYCVPCLGEHPALMEMKARGVPILGVAYKDKPENARTFLNQHGDPFEAVALDPDGRFGLDLGIAGMPETFVIDAQGRIRAVVRGPITEEILNRDILPALAAR
jgi:cytochrome c biogenesis protein CcmG/thiol:disulfide interchange protein DsbE